MNSSRTRAAGSAARARSLAYIHFPATKRATESGTSCCPTRAIVNGPAFSPGPFYKGDWSEGSKILFLAPNPDDSGKGGMVSRINENKSHELISIEHPGMVHNGVEDTESEEAKKWAPAYENYTFAAKDGGTELTIEMDIDEKEKAKFETMWSEVLAKLKSVAEEVIQRPIADLLPFRS